jgi:putative hydrolase of the HAD superfamily
VLDARRPVTHVLLDFFGTLVDYSPSRRAQGYYRSHEIAVAMGATAGYPEFLDAWGRESARLDQRSAADDREYAMAEVAESCLIRLLGRQPEPAEVTTFAQSYLAEWNTGVSYPAGMVATVAELASRHRLAVVSNTHDPDLVPAHLAAMGVDHYFEAVVTSIDFGWRKPHPAIYAEALRRLGAEADRTVFAGDTYDADFAGPVRAGLAAFLIDPDARHDVPAARRLSSLADLPARLSSAD